MGYGERVIWCAECGEEQFEAAGVEMGEELVCRSCAEDIEAEDAEAKAAEMQEAA